MEIEGQLTLEEIQSYNQQLECQNNAKQLQIKQLRKEVDIIALSSRLQIINHKLNCSECTKKEQQIATLLRALHLLRRTQKQSNSVSILDSQYQQKRQKVSQKPYYVLDKQHGDEQNEGHVQKSYLKMEMKELRESNGIYEQEIQNLKKRLSFYVGKVSELQKQKKTLIQQLSLNHKQLQNTIQNHHNPYGLQQPSNQLHTFYSTSPNVQTPLFSSMRVNLTKKNQSPTLETLPVRKTNQFETSKDTPVTTRGIPSNKSSYGRFHSPLQVNICQRNLSPPPSCTGRGNKFEQERRRSLNYKIKTLQGENKKLRGQIKHNNF